MSECADRVVRGGTSSTDAGRSPIRRRRRSPTGAGRALSRRELISGGAAAAGAALVAPFINLGRFRLYAGQSREYSARCIDLVTGSLIGK